MRRIDCRCNIAIIIMAIILSIYPSRNAIKAEIMFVWPNIWFALEPHMRRVFWRYLRHFRSDLMNTVEQELFLVRIPRIFAQ